MWSFHNPVRIVFGRDALSNLPALVNNRSYVLVTYGDPVFVPIVEQIKTLLGEPCLLISNVSPNPDFADLVGHCKQWRHCASEPQLIIALGGGSVMDTAKVLAAAAGDFCRVRGYLESGAGADQLATTPLLAIPTTAGTGSEVTSWATVWHAAENRKYSLNLPSLYPETALVDPVLTEQLPIGLTVSTALDALSHALESLWNRHCNGVSQSLAVSAARGIIENLPALVNDPADPVLRQRIALAALQAGLAFSNTKTALAHNISYPITMQYGVVHGIACSFTLPDILRSVVGQSEALDSAFRDIFQTPPQQCPQRLESFFAELGVSIRYQDYGIAPERWNEIVQSAFAGERGLNFIGNQARFFDTCVSN